MKKSEAGFSIFELFIIVVVLVVLASAGWFINNKGHKQTSTTTSQRSYASYSDCLNHGGQSLSYDGAIQFDACKAGNSNLYLQYSAQNLPRIDQNKTTAAPNIVVSNASATPDLVSYLTHNYTGCGIGQPANSNVTGYFKVDKEIPSGWALLTYGCSSDSAASKNAGANMIAMKLSSGWVEISPTNNFLPNGTPSCLLVDMFKVPSSLSSQCYQNTGYNDGSLRSVTN